MLWKPEEICTKANIRAKTNRDVRWVWAVPVVLDIIILVIVYFWFQDIKDASEPGRGIALSWIGIFALAGIFVIIPIIWLIVYLVAYFPKKTINTKRCADHPGDFPLVPKKSKKEKVGEAVVSGLVRGLTKKPSLR